MLDKRNGQVLIVVLFVVIAVFYSFFLVIGVGTTVYEKIAMQKAVDAASISASVWQARGLNIISDLNYALIAAGGGDIIKLFFGDFNFELYNAIIDTQNMVAKFFPLNAWWAYNKVFKENIKDAVCFPFPPNLFSLRVKRKEIDLWIFGKIKLWMEKDREYWDNQEKKGPFIRLVAYKKQHSFPVGSGFLGVEIPRITVVSQSAPYLKGKSGFLGGGLWNPHFDTRLVKVSGNITGINEIILH